MKKFSKLMLAMAIPAALLAGNANAVLITSWDYENQYGFSDWTAAASTNGGTTGITTGATNPNSNYQSPPFPALTPVPAVISGSPLSLSWGSANANGSGGNPSSFSLSSNTVSQEQPITGAQIGVAPTFLSASPNSGVFVPDLTLTHFNNPVYGETLNSVILNGALLMQALTPPNGSLIGPISAAFTIEFTETPNVAGTCVSTPGAACPDIFVIGAGSSPLTNVFLASIDDYSYFLDVGLTGLSGLDEAECLAAGSQAGCQGFVTQEGVSNSLELFFSIRAVENVPEPGTLALLGLGIAGLGLGRYRRRK